MICPLLWFCCASDEINGSLTYHLVASNQNVLKWTPHASCGQLAVCIYYIIFFNILKTATLFIIISYSYFISLIIVHNVLSLYD